MKNIDLKEQLLNTSIMAFEEVCFLFVMDDEKNGYDTENMVTSCVTFQGPYYGQLAISVSHELLDVITINITGEDQEFTPQQKYDALGEMANIICGNLLPQVAGPKEIFDLSAPQLINEMPISRLAEAKEEEIEICFDEGLVRIRFHINNN